jgi:NADH-quinone oxidoreductase subunit H
MDWILGFIILFIRAVAVLVILLGVAGVLVLVERKLLARFQVRYGPNRAGPFGSLQPLADIIKMLTKEDTMPEDADRAV